ncbi:MAG: tetratricopeptide repeat protein [Gemmataceae bacterium]
MSKPLDREPTATRRWLRTTAAALAFGLAALWAWAGWRGACKAPPATSWAGLPLGKENAFDRLSPKLLTGAQWHPGRTSPEGLVALIAQSQEVTSTSVSPDAGRVALGLRNRALVWNTGAATPAELPFEAAVVRAVALDATGTRLVVGGEHVENDKAGPVGWLQAYQITSERIISGSSEELICGVHALAFLPGQEGVVAVGGVGIEEKGGTGMKSHHLHLRRHDGGGWKHVVDLSTGDQVVSSLAASPDGRTLAAALDDGTVRLYNLRPAADRPAWAAQGLAWLLCACGALALVPRKWLGRMARQTAIGAAGLAVVTLMGVYWADDLGSHVYLVQTLGTPHAKHPARVSFSHDSQLLAVTSREHGHRLYRRQTGRWLEAGKDEATQDASFAAGGPWLVTADRQGRLSLLQTDLGRTIRQLPTGQNWSSSGLTNLLGCYGPPLVTATPEGRHAVVTDPARGAFVVRLWDQDGSDQTLADAEAVLARAPTDPAALGQRAMVRMRRGQLLLALADLNAALRSGPRKELFWLRGLTLARLQRPAEALADFRRVTELGPNEAAAHFQQGMILLAQRDYQRARKSFDEAFRLRPDLAAPVTEEEGK